MEKTDPSQVSAPTLPPGPRPVARRIEVPLLPPWKVQGSLPLPFCSIAPVLCSPVVGLHPTGLQAL